MQEIKKESNEFMNKVAIISGAASGIGKSVAFNLLEKGAKLVLVDLDLERLKNVYKDIDSKQVKLIKTNICLDEDRQRVLDEALELGTVNYLINAAGLVQVQDLFKVTESDWDEIQNVNVKANFFMCQLIGKYWIQKDKKGVIVNFSSSAAKMASSPELVAYSASKASVLAMTKTFAHLLADTGSRVNCVCPGVIQTPMQDAIQSRLENDVEKKVSWDARISRIPLKREGSSEEVASVIEFLLSNKSSYMTGQSINITGGMLME